MFDQYRSSVWALVRDQFNEQTVRESARRLALHSDGLLWLMHGHLCFLYAQQFMPPGADEETHKRLLLQAVRAYEVAVEKPSPFPVRAPALEALIIPEGLLGSPKRAAPDPEMRKRALTHLHQRMAMPAKLPLAWMEFYHKVARYAGDDNLARLILDERARRLPGDTSVTKYRARLEMQLGAYGAAVRLARQVLAGRPDDAEMKQLLREAAGKMREELRKLDQPPR